MRRPKSKKPRKQRKFLYEAPLHLRRKLMAAHLSPDLRKKYKTRSIPIRRGDEVEIMRGEFKGKKGKIMKVDLKKYKIYVEGITRRKTDGTQALVPIHPSKIKILSLNLANKRRVKILERRKG
jgi:large subunit ribosomal protein L24